MFKYNGRPYSEKNNFLKGKTQKGQNHVVTPEDVYIDQNSQVVKDIVGRIELADSLS